MLPINLRRLALSMSVAFLPAAVSADVPQSWSCQIESVFFTNGETGALQSAGNMFVGKTLLVDLSVGGVTAPDGPVYYAFDGSSEADILTFSTLSAQDAATLVDVSTAMGSGPQFTRVFMLEQRRRKDNVAPFQMMLPGEVVTGLCEALNA